MRCCGVCNMAWDSLKSDYRYRIPGSLIVEEYLLKNHNISVPEKRAGNVEGIIITGVPVHNIFNSDLSDYDDAKEYVRKTTGDGFIPHFYDGMKSTWQVLDFDDCWQRSDGLANSKTICIAGVISDTEFTVPANAVAFRDIQVLTAYILHKFKLPIASVKVAKECPEYIKSRWKEFKTGVKQQMKKM